MPGRVPGVPQETTGQVKKGRNMSNFRSEDSSFRRVSLISALSVAGVAAAVYALTLANYVFPGDSARLLVQWAGIDVLAFPEFPLWGYFVKLFAGGGDLSSVAFRANALSLVCGVVSAYLICRLMAFAVWQTVSHEDSIKFVKGASVAAGVVAALTFVFSTAVWQSSTHLEHRIFDVMWVLLTMRVILFAARRTRYSLPVAIVSGAFVAMGLVESPIFVPCSFAIFFAFMLVLVKNRKSLYGNALLYLLSVFIGIIVFVKYVSGGFIGTEAAEAAGCSSSFDVFLRIAKDSIREMRTWVSRPGWLAIVALSVLPAVSCAFAAGRGLNSDRRWSQYAFHIAMTLCVALALATALAPESILRPWGVSPVATSTLVALVSGYLAAYWYLLARCPLPVKEFKQDGGGSAARIGRGIAPVFGCALLLVIALSSLVNAFNCGKGRGEFADICAKEIVDSLGERTWFITDGTLDDHLRVAAATAKKELNLVCLQRDMNESYLEELSALVKERGLTAGNANLQMSIRLGVLPFIQDWFAGDTNVTQKAAIFGVPDFWYMAERMPVPENVLFGGAQSSKSVDGKALAAGFKAFWARIAPTLWTERNREGSRNIASCDDPVAKLRLQLRRHVGFVGNNLGVFLQDAGLDEEAFAIYELVLGTIDPDNVCALFNEFEMARAGIKCAASKKVEIERKLKAIVDDPKRRYALWSLSRYYGYIRNPEIFARMGYAWARSGQTGNAIAQVQRAIDFVSADRQTGLLNMMAAIYASGTQIKKSRAVYEQVLSSDANNREALMGMARLALQSGSADEAKTFLEKAANASGKDAPGVETALLLMMNNDLDRARLEMQKITDMHPKSLQAWSLLSGVLLQQLDQAKDAGVRTKILDELENSILPKMEAVTNDPRDYFVQMTRALVYMRKGPTFRRQARDALVIASMSRPDVSVAGDMILGLDIELDDGEAAERHARTILRRDRHDKLANYVMGSLRLKEGDYSTAETFLRLSVEAEKPIAAAQNDLAEVLRRLQRYADAEKYARDAVKNQPNLYVAWETLGAALLDQNKNLDEAEQCVQKAIKLSKTESKIEDIRMQLTLARVQIARGAMDKARTTVRTLRKRQAELSNYDRDQLETLDKAMRGGSKR